MHLPAALSRASAWPRPAHAEIILSQLSGHINRVRTRFVVLDAQQKYATRLTLQNAYRMLACMFLQQIVYTLSSMPAVHTLSCEGL